MNKHILVILDECSTSFCYYENKNYYSNESKLIKKENLSTIIEYARKNAYSINFLYGNNILPDDYNDLIETCNHMKIVPLKLKEYYDNALIVINRDDWHLTGKLEKNNNYIFNLRIKKDILPTLAEKVLSLSGTYKKLNLFLLEIDTYTENELGIYKKQLQIISKEISIISEENEFIETSFLTDRLFLEEMNNCNAGVNHFTIAPNGKMYICPGFYYEKNDEYIGDVNGITNLKNGNLFDLEDSPICLKCDAYQCKRCVYLNKKMTLEVNTPSHQQCVISHIERNSSRQLARQFDEHQIKSSGMNIIPEIEYLDPIVLFETAGKTHEETGKRKSSKKNTLTTLSMPIPQLELD